jgi:hypothetical protein
MENQQELSPESIRDILTRPLALMGSTDAHSWALGTEVPLALDQENHIRSASPIQTGDAPRLLSCPDTSSTNLLSTLSCFLPEVSPVQLQVLESAIQGALSGCGGTLPANIFAEKLKNALQRQRGSNNRRIGFCHEK